jgi:hypothetical protein
MPSYMDGGSSDCNCDIGIHRFVRRPVVGRLVRVALVAVRDEAERRHDLVLDDVIPLSPLL